VHGVRPEQRGGDAPPSVTPVGEHVGRLHVIVHLFGQLAVGIGLLDSGEHLVRGRVIVERE
jgi:hypothetical protein